MERWELLWLLKFRCSRTPLGKKSSELKKGAGPPAASMFVRMTKSKMPFKSLVTKAICVSRCCTSVWSVLTSLSAARRACSAALSGTSWSFRSCSWFCCKVCRRLSRNLISRFRASRSRSFLAKSSSMCMMAPHSTDSTSASAAFADASSSLIGALASLKFVSWASSCSRRSAQVCTSKSYALRRLANSSSHLRSCSCSAAHCFSSSLSASRSNSIASSPKPSSSAEEELPLPM
mmetsp:Transcript_75291/g.137472  ORF Transcript_75291/g.137472 Transcript_75291/m.137472 type:complete len:234 (-) Transcript_75291:89-790(-)